MTNFTNVLYESSHINYFTKKDDYRGVCATADIKKGTVLLVEHALAGTSDYLMNSLVHDEELYNALSPRTNKWEEQMHITPEKYYSEVRKKVEANAFGHDSWENGIWNLGFKLSSFNHSTVPNSINIGRKEPLGEISQYYVYVKTIDDLSKGDEITMSYGDGVNSATGHNFISPESDITHNVLVACYSRDKDEFANRIIDQYFGKFESVALLRRQELARNGLYSINDGGIITTPIWLKKMKEVLPNEDDTAVLVQKQIEMLDNQVKDAILHAEPGKIAELQQEAIILLAQTDPESEEARNIQTEIEARREELNHLEST